MSYFPLLVGAMPLVCYMVAIWETDPKRLMVHAGLAAAMIAYLLIQSGFKPNQDSVFFLVLAGAWLLGAALRALGLWARSRSLAVGRWRVAEIFGGLFSGIPIALASWDILQSLSA